MLKINVRIERLLNEKDLIKRMDIFGLNIYTIADIEQFMKNNNSINKPSCSIFIFKISKRFCIKNVGINAKSTQHEQKFLL